MRSTEKKFLMYLIWKVNKNEYIFDYKDTSIYYSFEKPVSDFISSDNQNEEICKWFTEKINAINEFKQSIKF